MKCSILAHSIFSPLCALSFGMYYYVGPNHGKTSENIRAFQNVVFPICITITLFSLLLLTLAFIEVATSMKQLRGFQRARYPLIAFSTIFFLTQIIMYFAGKANEVIYVTIAMVCVLLVLVIFGPGWMFYKFSESLMHEKNAVGRKNGASYGRKQTLLGGFQSCCKALTTDIAKSIFNDYDSSSLQGSDSEENNSNNKNSKEEKVTDPTHATVINSMHSKEEKVTDLSTPVRIGGSLITFIAHPESDPENDTRDRSESKDSKISLDMSQSSKESPSPTITKTFSGSANSKILSLTKSDSFNNPKRISQRAEGTEKKSKNDNKAETQHKSNRKVAKFLSRVLQLSMRLGLLLFLFISSSIVAIPLGNKYFSLSLNVALISLQTVTRFFQIFYIFLILDSILWFFSDVLRRELSKLNKQNNSAAGNKNIVHIQHDDSKIENHVGSGAKIGSKTEISKTSSVANMVEITHGVSKVTQSNYEGNNDCELSVDTMPKSTSD